MTLSNLRVLISGASIAGPMTAYWFSRAGAHVTLVERFSSLRLNGQNVDIRSIGVTVMRKIPGLEESIRARKCDIEGIEFVDDTGRPYATMKATGDANQQSLVSEYEIFRGDLARILVDLTREERTVEYVFGEQIVGMQQMRDGDGDGPVTVSFANGRPTAEYDLVVACDGAASRSRSIGLNCGVRDYVNPLNTWAAYFTMEQDLLGGSKTVQSWSTIGGRWMAVAQDPSGHNTVGMMSNSPDESHMASFREASKLGTDALKSHVLQRYKGAGWETDVILDGMTKSQDFYASEIVQVKLPSLYRGHFVLVGDAGYAAGPIGTGTSLAIAGAYILAGEIAQHSGDIAAGLKAYEERMRPIIDDMQTLPPGYPGLLMPQTAWGIRSRNLLFMVVALAMRFSGSFTWLSRFLPSSFREEQYGVPNYEALSHPKAPGVDRNC